MKFRALSFLLLCFVLPAQTPNPSVGGSAKVGGVTILGGGIGIAAPPAFVQDRVNTTACFSASNTCSITMTSNPTAGNALAVFLIKAGGGTFSGVAIADTCGSSGGASNTYTTDSNVNIRFSGHAIVGATHACTITTTFTGAGGGYVMLYAQEISNVNNSTPVGSGQFSSNQQFSPGTAANVITSGNITTTVFNSYIAAVCVNVSLSLTTLTSGTGFTPGKTSTGGGIAYLVSEYRTVGSTGTYAANCTDSTNGGGSYYFNTAAIAFEHP